MSLGKVPDLPSQIAIQLLGGAGHAQRRGERVVVIVAPDFFWFYPFGPNLAGVPEELGQMFAVTADRQHHFVSNLPMQKLRNRVLLLRNCGFQL